MSTFKHGFFRRSFLLLAAFFVVGTGAFAGETAKKDDQQKESQETVINERVRVVGSKEAAAKEPGSAHFITKEQLEEQDYTDIHRVLREVPGVNIQEEDGLGLRPNIGMRGTGVERSAKITLMEDGVLIAPAPYTAPSAYYFPTAGRMESLEVLKGSASIKQGPFTNGGTLNMISTSIPTEFSGSFDLSAGSHNTGKLHTYAGTAKERWGLLVETFQLDTKGFKELDNGGDTGVNLQDYMLKFRVNSAPAADLYQSLELKLGKTEQDGDETYLGLTAGDFEANPYRRYAGSQEDWIKTDHEQVQLRWFVKPTQSTDITTTVYNNDFQRNWHKMERTNGVSNGSILENPEQYADELAIIRGEMDSDPGALRVRNNNRTYYSRGIQSTLFHTVETGSAAHEISFGVRYHEDEEDRLQHDENWQMLNGDMVLSSVNAPGSATNRASSAEALSLFLTDTISSGNWSFRPGLRYESIDYVREDYDTADPTRSLGPERVRENSVDVFSPGIGIDYQVTMSDRLFVGIHRGFSPPGAGANPETKEEESTNYELGWRRNTGNLRAELIGFYNDYDNLLGEERVSGGGDVTGELYNGGAVEVSGLEAMMAYRFDTAIGQMPLNMTYTYTQSEFKTSFESGFADWEPFVEAGDELPYIPENQLSLSLGLVRDTWDIYLNSNYSDEMRTKAGQGAIPAGEGTDSRWVFDLSTHVTVFKQYKVFAQVRNLFDETYIVARRPYGLRPGLERTFLVGFKANF